MRSKFLTASPRWAWLLLLAAALSTLFGLRDFSSRDELGEARSGQLKERAIPIEALARGANENFRLIPPASALPGRSAKGLPVAGELVLLDRSLADLAEELARNGRMVLLVGGPDGLADAARKLPMHARFAAIHIVSHGRPGSFSLDGATFDAATLGSPKGAGFDLLAKHLKPDGDILIYGCEAANGPAGRTLIRAIADRTGANVAASERPTGVGDWALSSHIGRVATAPLRLPRPVALWTAELFEGGWYGDSNVPVGAVSPHPKANLSGTGRLSMMGDNTGGPGVTFSVQQLGCCTAQTIANASTTSYAAAVTANDYFYSDIVVGGTNGAAISKLQYNQVSNNTTGAQIEVALYDTVTTTLTTLTGALTVSGSTTGIQIATTPVAMVPGRTYQLRFYGFKCGASATCYLDNPSIWTKSNEAPIAVSDSFTTTYATAVSGNLVSNDSDPESQTLSISAINGAAYTVGVPIAMAGGTLTMTNTAGAFSFTPASGFYGSQSFTYTLNDGFGGTATAAANVSVNQADLSLTMTVANAFVWQGGTQSFTLTVTNNASSTVTASGITVLDSLPAGFSFSSVTGTGSYNASTGVWAVGSLAPGASANLTINGTVTASPRSTVSNAAEISASSIVDPDSTPNNGAVGEDDHAAASFSVIDPSLSVLKTSHVIADGINSSDFKAIPGANVRYCILITNTGNTTATGIVASDVLPGEVNLITNSARTGSTCDSANSTGGLTISGANITASSASLAPGQTFAVIYDVSLS